MYIHGSFADYHGRIITVHIVTNQDYSDEVEIGGDDNDSEIMFTDDPVEIDTSLNDCFDTIISSSATLHFYVRKHMEELFCDTPFDAAVNIVREELDSSGVVTDSTILFAGFIEPMSYEQSFAEPLDELDINCIDCLAALQYVNYKGVGLSGVDFDTVFSECGTVNIMDAAVYAETYSLAWIIQKCLIKGVGDRLSGGYPSAYIWYPESDRTLTSGDTSWAGAETYITDQLFMGEDEDDVWTLEDIVTELMQYYSSHIIQEGLDFYICSWDLVRAGGTFTAGAMITSSSTKETSGLDSIPDGWYNSSASSASFPGTTLTFVAKGDDDDEALVADDEATLSVGEVYNQIAITDEMEEIESVIESPLDDDDLSSNYDRKMLYMTEYLAYGSGERCHKCFRYLIFGTKDNSDYGYTIEGSTRTADYDSWQTDWYLKPMMNANWTFNMTNGESVSATDGQSSLSTCLSNGTYANWMAYCFRYSMMCGVIEIGSVDIHVTGSADAAIYDKSLYDDSPSMSPALVISVNGGHETSVSSGTPSSSTLLANAPMATYTGTSSGSWSPTDSDTTYYIVISGSLTMVPIIDMTASYKDIYEHPTEWKAAAYSLSSAGKQSWNENGEIKKRQYGFLGSGNRQGIYTRRLYASESPIDNRSSATTWYPSGSTVHDSGDYDKEDTMMPYTTYQHQDFEFDSFYVNGSKVYSDNCNKVPIVACMLIIGDKCAVETSFEGEVSDIVWQDYKTLDECADEEEYYSQCFYIGIDPARGTYLVGAQHDLMNNVTTSMNIDAEGMAIPITKDDALYGNVEFKILGPVQLTFSSKRTYRATTWYDYYDTSGTPVLPTVQNILIEDFEVKIYSDNGGIEESSLSESDNDVIYQSDEDESFINRKDDISFRFTTALSSEEGAAMGAMVGANMSTPLCLDNGDEDSGSYSAIETIYNAVIGEESKAENLFIHSFYLECHTPKVELDINIEDVDGKAGWFRHYYHSAAGKEFYVMGISRNLMEGTAEMHLKEVFDNDI